MPNQLASVAARINSTTEESEQNNAPRPNPADKLGSMGHAVASTSAEENVTPPTVPPEVPAEGGDNSLASKDTTSLLKTIKDLLVRLNILGDRQLEAEGDRIRSTRESFLEHTQAANDNEPVARRLITPQSKRMGMLGLAIAAFAGIIATVGTAIEGAVTSITNLVGGGSTPEQQQAGEAARRILNGESPVGDSSVSTRTYPSARHNVGENQIQERYARIARSDPAFHAEVLRVARKYRIRPNDLYGVIDTESAGTFRANVTNPRSSATGLIQFMTGPGTWARTHGYTRQSLMAMTRARQMRVVDEYFRDNLAPRTRGRPASLSDVYLSVAAPSKVGRPANSVAYASGSREARANRAWDINHDGTIQVGEVGQAAQIRMNRAGNPVDISQISGSGGGGITSSQRSPVAMTAPAPAEPSSHAPSQSQIFQPMYNFNVMSGRGRPSVPVPSANAMTNSRTYQQYFNTVTPHTQH